MIWRSKAFWTSVLDAIVSISLFVVATYTEPPLSDLLKLVIAAIQPIALALIAEFCVEKFAENIAHMLKK